MSGSSYVEEGILPRVTSPAFPLHVDVARAVVSHNTCSAAALTHRLGYEGRAAAVPCCCVDVVSGCVDGQH